ncbi:MAG: ETC complex I subunit [Emcibacter sp.]|nr:ETC complex I subunit [Emcibacter sp.]
MAKTRSWVMVFAPQSPRKIDPLMGWTSSSDMDGQIQLTFTSKEGAVSYAKRNNIDFEVIEPKARKIKIKSYADVFAYRG